MSKKAGYTIFALLILASFVIGYFRNHYSPNGPSTTQISADKDKTDEKTSQSIPIKLNEKNNFEYLSAEQVGDSYFIVVGDKNTQLCYLYVQRNGGDCIIPYKKSDGTQFRIIDYEGLQAAPVPTGAQSAPTVAVPEDTSYTSGNISTTSE